MEEACASNLSESLAMMVAEGWSHNQREMRRWRGGLWDFCLFVLVCLRWVLLGVFKMSEYCQEGSRITPKVEG